MALKETFREARAELCLDSVRPALDVTMEPYMETSVLALGELRSACSNVKQEPTPVQRGDTARPTGRYNSTAHPSPAGHTALACPQLEAECVLLISAHVAQQPLQLGLARCVLDACAACLGYPDRAAYAHMFAWCTTSSWFRLGHSLQELLGVQVLVRFVYIRIAF